jgi:hypothetical protein
MKGKTLAIAMMQFRYSFVELYCQMLYNALAMRLCGQRSENCAEGQYHYSGI